MSTNLWFIDHSYETSDGYGPRGNNTGHDSSDRKSNYQSSLEGDRRGFPDENGQSHSTYGDRNESERRGNDPHGTGFSSGGRGDSSYSGDRRDDDSRYGNPSSMNRPWGSGNGDNRNNSRDYDAYGGGRQNGNPGNTPDTSSSRTDRPSHSSGNYGGSRQENDGNDNGRRNDTSSYGSHTSSYGNDRPGQSGGHGTGTGGGDGQDYKGHNSSQNTESYESKTKSSGGALGDLLGGKSDKRDDDNKSSKKEDETFTDKIIQGVADYAKKRW